MDRASDGKEVKMPEHEVDAHIRYGNFWLVKDNELFFCNTEVLHFGHKMQKPLEQKLPGVKVIRKKFIVQPIKVDRETGELIKWEEIRHDIKCSVWLKFEK